MATEALCISKQVKYVYRKLRDTKISLDRILSDPSEKFFSRKFFWTFALPRMAFRKNIFFQFIRFLCRTNENLFQAWDFISLLERKYCLSLDSFLFVDRFVSFE